MKHFTLMDRIVWWIEVDMMGTWNRVAIEQAMRLEEDLQKGSGQSLMRFEHRFPNGKVVPYEIDMVRMMQTNLLSHTSRKLFRQVQRLN